MQKTQEWGEYFPYSIAPFAYNETIAQEHFPIDENQAKCLGANWKEEEPISQKGEDFKPADDIRDVGDGILEHTLKCEVSGRAFKIIPQELKFYKQQGLPIPHKHPDIRHLERIARRNPHQLWQRSCAKCGASIETSYSPERTETIYCEKCYLEEVY